MQLRKVQWLFEEGDRRLAIDRYELHSDALLPSDVINVRALEEFHQGINRDQVDKVMTILHER